jgi:hypothetical protein
LAGGWSHTLAAGKCSRLEMLYFNLSLHLVV